MDKDNVQRRIAARITKAREIARLRQVDLARRVGVSTTTVKSWEAGRFDVSARYLPLLASALGLTVAILLDDMDKPDDTEWAIRIEARLVSDEVRQQICREMFREMTDREARARDHAAIGLGAAAYAMA